MDFRSDTVTKPDQRMRLAMAEAIVGDDVYGDDPTVIALEEKMAGLLGKEAGLFVPSGTFSNQCAIMTHTKRGDEVIALEDSHIVIHEVGAAAVLSQVTVRQARSHHGMYDLNELKELIRGQDIHYPDTSLICLENAHGNGKAISLEHINEVTALAKEHALKVHLDGARIFNAALALGVSAAELTAGCDSVSVCLSKGLGAPVGSVLVGSADFIRRARKNRKLMGGGMRQVGILAAAGLVALEEMRDRLTWDHENACYLEERLTEIPEFRILKDRRDINMIFFTTDLSLDLEAELKYRDILINGPEGGEYRLVTNKEVTRESIDKLLIALKEILHGGN